MANSAIDSLANDPPPLPLPILQVELQKEGYPPPGALRQFDTEVIRHAG